MWLLASGKHSCVWHDSIHMCSMTHSYVWHDSFIRVTWLIHMCDMTRSFDTTHSFVWHDLFICVTWLIHMCDMTCYHVCYMACMSNFSRLARKHSHKSAHYQIYYVKSLNICWEISKYFWEFAPASLHDSELTKFPTICFLNAFGKITTERTAENFLNTFENLFQPLENSELTKFRQSLLYRFLRRTRSCEHTFENFLQFFHKLSD